MDLRDFDVFEDSITYPDVDDNPVTTTQHHATHNTPITIVTKCHRDINIASWGIKFDGQSCVRDFFIKVEEAIISKEVSHAKIIKRFHEFLNGTALKFFRSQRDTVSNWQHLKDIFYSQFDVIDFDTKMHQHIYSLKQTQNQTVSDFVIEIKDLNSKLKDPIPDSKLVSIIKYNLLPSYTPCLSVSYIPNLETLVAMTRNFESFNNSSNNLNAFHQSNKFINKQQTYRVAPVVADAPLCLKCKHTGHSYRACPNIQGVICFKCGTPDTVSSKCTKCNNNPTTSYQKN